RRRTASSGIQFPPLASIAVLRVARGGSTLEHAQLHDTVEIERATGFRPCKRCNPDGPSVDAENAALVAKACRLIEESEEEPSLHVWAEAVARSPTSFPAKFEPQTREGYPRSVPGGKSTATLACPTHPGDRPRMPALRDEPLYPPLLASRPGLGQPRPQL